MAIDTLENVKLELAVSGIGDDTLVTRLMDVAESLIAEYTRRDFAGGSFTETHPGGGAFVFLRNFPVTSVTDVRVDPTRLFGSKTIRAADAYAVHTARGVVESLAGPFLPPRPGRGPDDWPGTVRVTYATAAGQVPVAIRSAFSQLVGHWFRQAKTNSDLNHQLLTERGDASGTKTYSWALTAGLRLPPGVLQVLGPFRVPPI